MTKNGTTKKKKKKTMAKTKAKSCRQPASKKPTQKKDSKMYLCTSKGVVLGEVKPVK